MTSAPLRRLPRWQSDAEVRVVSIVTLKDIQSYICFSLSADVMTTTMDCHDDDGRIDPCSFRLDNNRRESDRIR